MDVRYTIERAEKEGLVKGNAAQYKSRPSKMLYWKCIGELTDRMIPHLTGGMPIKEDVQQSTPVKATATRADRRGGARAALSAAAQQTAQPEPEPAEVDEITDAYVTAIKEAVTRADIQSIMAQAKDDDLLTDTDRDNLAATANERWEELA